jgi:hypothetical protein
MESKIEQPEFQKTEKLRTEKPKIIFEKLKERYEQFRDSDLTRTFRNTLLALGTALYVACAPTIQQTPTKPVEPPKQTSTVQTSQQTISTARTLYLGPSSIRSTRDVDKDMLPFDEENLKKLSRVELKGPNYTLHILYYNEGVGEEKRRVKKLDDFKQLSTYFCLSCRRMIVERDMTKLNHYFSIEPYNYFFNIYTKPLEFELYVKTLAYVRGEYINRIKDQGIYFDIIGDVLETKQPIKQNSVKVIIAYVPIDVTYEDKKGISESVDYYESVGYYATKLVFHSNDPNKSIRGDSKSSSIDQVIENTILSNTYTLSLDIDKNSGQKDPFLKGLLNLAQNPTDPNTYSIIKPLFDKIEKQMVDIMLKKYQSYKLLYVRASILVFVIDPAKQDNMQIVVIPGDHKIVIKSEYK